ncbi:hypothetical protein SNE40_008423 [Patella caerulea]
MKNNEGASEKMKHELQLREKQLMAASELLSKQTKLLQTLETNINKRFSGSGPTDVSSGNMPNMATSISRPDMANMPMSNRPLVSDMGMPDMPDIGMSMPNMGSDLSMPMPNMGMPSGQNIGNMDMPIPGIGNTYDVPPMGMGMDGSNPPFEYDHRPGRFSKLEGPDPSFGSDSFPFEYDHKPGRFSAMPQPISRDYHHGRDTFLGEGYLSQPPDQSRKRSRNQNNVGLKNSSSRQNYRNLKPVPEQKGFQSKTQHTNQGNKNKGPNHQNKGANQQNKGANQQNKGPNQQNKGSNQQNKGPNQQNKGPKQQNKNKRSIEQSQGPHQPPPDLMSLKSYRNSNKPAVTGNELASSFIGSFCPSCNLKIREPNHHLIQPHVGRMKKVKRGCLICGTGGFRHHVELEHHMSSREHRRIRRLMRQYPNTKLKYGSIKTGVSPYNSTNTDIVYGAEVVEEMTGRYCHACDMFFPSNDSTRDYRKHLTYRTHHTNYVKYKKAKLFEELLVQQGDGVGVKGNNSMEEAEENVDAEDGIDMEMDGNDF